MRGAIATIAEQRSAADLLFIALGEDAEPEQIGRATIQFVPYQQDPAIVARYCQAADLYLHAARAEAWGLTITEALACGTPVVATAVGGIPEQVKGLRMDDGQGIDDLNRSGADEATGVLVPVGDARAMARCIEHLLNDDGLRRRLSHNAADDARERFDLNRQVKSYLDWYEQILANASERIA